MIKSRRMRWAMHVERMGEKILFGRKRPRRRCGNKMKIDLKKIGWKGVDWILLAQDMGRWWTLANMVMSFQIP
jgi:hypothetical protein